MLSDTILDSECLYRAINPIYFREEGYSSAAFKDRNGVSVDRDAGREEPDIIAFLLAGFASGWGAARVTAKDCWVCNTFPVVKPEPDNPYHAEIHQSQDRVGLSQGRAKCLTKAAILLYRPTNA